MTTPADIERELAQAMAKAFADEWFAHVLRHAPPKRKVGRPSLVVPSQHREKYPQWRRLYGARMAREMAGIAA